MSVIKQRPILKPFGGCPPKPITLTHEEVVTNAKNYALEWLRNVHYHCMYVDEHVGDMGLLPECDEITED